MPYGPARKGIHESMDDVDGISRRPRVVHGCPMGLRARASMRAWWVPMPERTPGYAGVQIFGGWSRQWSSRLH